jgi:hypothetical protein
MNVCTNGCEIISFKALIDEPSHEAGLTNRPLSEKDYLQQVISSFWQVYNAPLRSDALLVLAKVNHLIIISGVIKNQKRHTAFHRSKDE